MYKNKKIGVVVPAYNEEKFIGAVIDAMPDFVDRIYAVNDASVDNTRKIMNDKASENNKVTVIDRKARGGVGAAILSGHIQALRDDIDISAVMAGDGQMAPDMLESIIEPIVRGQADYVKGDRLSRGEHRKEMPVWRIFGNTLLTSLTRIASGYWHISDPQDGYTAIATKILKNINLDGIEKGFAFENDMLVKLNVAGARIVDVQHPAIYRGQQSKINYSKFIIRTSWILARDFFWRIWATYFARNNGRAAPVLTDTKQKQIRALFCINTPAQAHTWRNVINELMRKGYKVRILARDYGSTAEILKSAGLHADTFRPIKQNYLRLFEIIVHLYHGLKVAKEFDPTITVGFGVDAALMAGLLRKPCIIFVDSENVAVQHFLNKIFAKAIVTPGCFAKDLGKKQLRIEGYKELAYLHPDYFQPAPSIYDELGLCKNEKYIILRFNIFDAIHDIGSYGFSASDQSLLVQKLSKYARVFISPEAPLPKELEKYRLTVPYERIHDVLYYAQLLVTDTQTMATEAAILGTPTIRCNSFVDTVRVGNFIELEEKYDLVYSIRDTGKAMLKAEELIQQPDIKEQWARKREKLLSDKIDVARFMIDLIERYPDSLKNCRERTN